MSARRWAALALAAVACGNFDLTGEGVAFLEVIRPDSLSVFQGDTLRFSARALDRNGDSIPVDIRWRTPDTTIEVDAAGLVTGRYPGIGRIQAVTGDEGGDLPGFIVSDFFQVTVVDTVGT